MEELEAREMMTTVSIDDVGLNYWPGFQSQFTVTMGSEENVLDLATGDATTVNAAQNGTVEINDEGKLVYTPNDGFEGRDSFSYSRNVNDWWSNVHVSIDVVFPFVTVPDWTYVETGSNEIEIDVLSNDRWNNFEPNKAVAETLLYGSGAMGDWLQTDSPNLTITSVSACEHGGSIRIADDGKSIFYLPGDGFEGLDEFSYTVTDELGHEDTAVAQVRVSQEDYDPTTATHFRWEEEYVHSQIISELKEGRRTDYYPPYVLYDHVSFNLSNTNSIDTRISSSSTNVQVNGVDEADLIENDGEHIYWLSSRTIGGELVHELVILSAATPEELSVVSRVEFDDEPQAMFLFEDRLTVLTTTRTNVGVTVLDVADRSAPTVVETNSVEGQFDDARMVDGRLYLFVNLQTDRSNFSNLRIATIPYYHYGNFQTPRELLEGLQERSWLPQIVSQTATGETMSKTILDVTTIRKDAAEIQDDSAIMVFDTTDDAAGISSSVSLDFNPETIYMDADSIYLTSSYTKRLQHWSWNTTSKTEIFSYSISDDGLQLEFEASGMVLGNISNQFAMDEHNGQLRVATNYWGGSSAVYIFEAKGDKLQMVGGLAGLAPGQLLYSARFMGDRAYLVTYQKVDPLHVIDLSDTSAPVELGQLVIPGFSDYLHPISENLIIGLGRSASPDGFFRELQVSLFDVSNPYKPVRLYNYLIDGGRTTRFFGKGNPWGIGDIDHHAFSYFAEHGILALPLYSDGWDRYGEGRLYEGDSSGVHLLSINESNGIELLGEIDFDDRVGRSIRVGETIYALSDEMIKGVSVSQPDQIVVEVSMGDSREAGLNVSAPTHIESTCEPTVVATFDPATGGETTSPTSPTTVAEGVGDVNEDGAVDGADVDLVFASLGTENTAADLNSDGMVDEKDVDYLIEDVLNTTRGDVNLDGQVDREDFAILIANLESEEATWSLGDLDGDGQIDMADALLMIEHFDMA